MVTEQLLDLMLHKKDKAYIEFRYGCIPSVQVLIKSYQQDLKRSNKLRLQQFNRIENYLSNDGITKKKLKNYLIDNGYYNIELATEHLIKGLNLKLGSSIKIPKSESKTPIEVILTDSLYDRFSDALTKYIDRVSTYIDNSRKIIEIANISSITDISVLKKVYEIDIINVMDNLRLINNIREHNG